jgi:hypothetical protein
MEQDAALLCNRADHHAAGGRHAALSDLNSFNNTI